MKVIDYLHQLPEPYRSEAIANADKDELDSEAYELAAALTMAFTWSHTPQGYKYWQTVRHLALTLFKGEPRTEHAPMPMLAYPYPFESDIKGDYTFTESNQHSDMDSADHSRGY